MEATAEQTATSMRAVLAEGELRVRDALHALVTQGLGMEVVGEAQTLAALRCEVQAQHPDLAIVAWDLLAASEAALESVRASAPGVRIVVIALRPEMEPAALAAGADGFVSKVDAPDVVVRVLQTATERVPGGLS